MDYDDFKEGFAFVMGVLERFAQTVLVADALIIIAVLVGQQLEGDAERLSRGNAFILPIGFAMMILTGWMLNLWAMLRAMDEVWLVTKHRPVTKWVGRAFVVMLGAAAVAIPVHAVRTTVL